MGNLTKERLEITVTLMITRLAERWVKPEAAIVSRMVESFTRLLSSGEIV
jgi:hypothetical protein